MFPISFYIFRVWTGNEDAGFKPKSWSTSGSPVDALAWHPRGSFVVFSTNSILFSVNFTPPSVEFTSSSLAPEIVPLFNIRECEVPQSQSNEMYK